MFNNSNVLCAGLDAGNGEQKTVICCPGDGGMNLLKTKFPMVYYPGEDRPTVKFDDNKKQEDALDVTVRFKDGQAQHYFFGNLAATYEGVTHIFDANKVENDALKAAMYVSLALLQDQEKQAYYVCTGTPYGDFKEQGDNFKKKLPDTCEITFNAGPLRGKTLTVSIIGVIPSIQGLGIYVNETMDYEGKTIRPELGDGEVAILDIGQGTTNFMLIKDGVPVAAGCETINGVAMKTVYDALAKAIKDEWNETVEGARIIEIYRTGTFYYNGENHDLRANGMLPKAKLALANLIQNNLKRKWPHFKMFKRILIGGGGGIAIGNLFSKISHKQIVEDQYANAKGYLKTVLYQVLRAKKSSPGLMRKAE